MTELTALWLPTLLSAVLVFVVSSIIHMATPWHKGDYRKVPDEDKFMAAVRALNIPPGDYMTPRPGGMAEMRSPEFQEKYKKGPVMVLTVMPPDHNWMGKQLAFWFVYSAVVGLFAGYVASHALAPGANYLQVFRFVGATAFAGYSLALWQFSIWYRRAWGSTLRSTIDGLIYALLTAGTFGWLWPK